MPVIPIRKFTPEFIHRLIEMKIPESDFLEYQADLRFGTTEEKKELLADVSSFANSGGGNIVFGIEEGSRGEPVSICGLPGLDSATCVTAIDDIFRLGFSRPIPGLEVRVISLEKSSPLLVIHIPFSIRVPHCIGVESDLSGYFTRKSSKRQQMTLAEIRESDRFLLGFLPKLWEHQKKRLSKILSEKKGGTLSGSGNIIILLTPALALLGRSTVDIDEISSYSQGKPIFGYSKFSSRFNSNGWLKFCDAGEGESVYVQYFHSGIIEAVDRTTVKSICDNIQEDPRQGGEGHLRARSIAKLRVEHCIVQEVKSGLDVFMQTEIDFPLFVSMAVTGLSGIPAFRVRRERSTDVLDGEPSDYFDVGPELPEGTSDFFVVDLLTEPSDVASALKPKLERLWESLGWTF